MKILITGGAGFIGSHIADRLVAKNHDVTVLDNLSSGKREQVPAHAQFLNLDIRSEAAASTLEQQGFEIVFHEAAQIDVRASVQDPRNDADVNICGLVNVVEAARKGGRLQQVLFASSGGAIYGEQQAFPASETHPTQPESPYGVAKLCCEHYLQWFSRTYGLCTTALRYANVYGPRQDPHGEAGVVAIFSQLLMHKKQAIIFGDGEQTRDFVFVGDVADANVAAMETKVAGAYNIGTSVETSVNALYKILAAHAGVTSAAQYEDARLGEQRRSVIDAGLAADVFGFKPTTSIVDGLRLTYESFVQSDCGSNG